MKHCPNPDCPHARSTGRPAEYENLVVECADCNSALADGPAPDPPPDDTDRIVTIAEFSTSHEAHVARAALESHGVVALVDQDHSPYVSASPWVQLHVAQSDAEIARRVLEQGPLLAAETGGAPAPVAPDDMRPLRLSRRIVLARWFLYAQAVSGFLTSLWILANPLFGLISFLAAAVALFVALWSRREPRRALTIGLGYQLVVILGTLATAGPTGFLSLIPAVAVYFGWAAAGKKPPDRLLAEPEATRSAEIAIGETWKAEPAIDGAASGPTTRWRRVLVFALLAIVLLVIGGVLTLYSLIQGMARG